MKVRKEKLNIEDFLEINSLNCTIGFNNITCNGLKDFAELLISGMDDTRAVKVMSRINIKYMSRRNYWDLKSKSKQIHGQANKQPKDHSWIYEINPGKTFIEKKHTIEDFVLELPKDINDKETQIKNSITLYEHLKELPKYILTDEKFWNWINFEKAYEVALKTIPISKDSKVFKNHWLFSQGDRRSIFFGVFSRSYFRVALSIDERREDPYELSRFVIEKPNRFRNLSWRTFSSNKKIVLGTLRAKKQILEDYGNEEVEKTSYFTEIAKDISKLGSVMLLDVMEEEDIYDYVYEKYKQKIEEDLNKA